MTGRYIGVLSNKNNVKPVCTRTGQWTSIIVGKY